MHSPIWHIKSQHPPHADCAGGIDAAPVWCRVRHNMPLDLRRFSQSIGAKTGKATDTPIARPVVGWISHQETIFHVFGYETHLLQMSHDPF